MTELYLDGGEDPTFKQVDEYLRSHFNARAVHIDEIMGVVTFPDKPRTMASRALLGGMDSKTMTLTLTVELLLVALSRVEAEARLSEQQRVLLAVGP